MKRTFSLLSVLALTLVFTGNIFAQVVNASAEVISDVTYSKETDLNFGTFQTSFTGTATIDPANSGNDTNVNGTRDADYYAGKIFIDGASDQTVTVTLDNTSIDLTAGGADSFTLNPISLSAATGEEGANEGGDASFSSGNTVDLDNSGAATVWIGGDLTANDDGDGSMEAAVYENTSDLTFTVDYSL